MPLSANAAAATDVGKIRSNNQDSGYAGTHLFMIADGMGGHAGGDVASAIAANRIIEADAAYETVEDAQFAMQDAIMAANDQLSETVFEHPELTGMGTTVDALMIVGDEVAIAHIGDSRIYLYRDGEQLESFKLGYALSEMQRRFPGVAMRGVVVVHSTTGKLQRPSIEMASSPHYRRIDDRYAPVAVMNPSELINLLQAQIRDCNDNAVHVPLLRELLRLSK